MLFVFISVIFALLCLLNYFVFNFAIDKLELSNRYKYFNRFYGVFLCLLFVALITTPVPALAAEAPSSVPKLPEIESFTDQYDYVIYYDSGDELTHLYAFNPSVKGGFFARFVTPSNALYFSGASVSTVPLNTNCIEEYKLVDGVWVHDRSTAFSGKNGDGSCWFARWGGSGKDLTLLYSSVDVMSAGDTFSNTSGVYFPSQPCPNLTPLEAAIQGGLLDLEVAALGAMKILLICGIVCLASLIGLRVFMKVFHRFQVL